MTKEEIIKAAIKPLQPTYNLTIADCQAIVFPAMDQYAKQESISFVEWIDRHRVGGTLHKAPDAEIWNYFVDGKNISATTDQLYTLYQINKR